MIHRRNALAGLLGAGAALSMPGRLFAADPGLSLDVTSPEGRQRHFMMMRCALDEDLVISWVQASYFGVVEDEMMPLFGVSSAVFSRARRQADGSYRLVSFELAWFTDPVTGKAMETFRNPYTNQDCTVPSGGFQPSASVFGRDLSFNLPKPIPGLTIEHEVLPFVVRGDDVWVSEQMRSSSLFPGAKKPFRYSDNSVLHARKSDLLKPGATRVTSDVSYTNVVSWRPWLGMGDRPGHLTASGVGRQNADRDSLPPAWVEATAARKPEVLKDPAAILAPLWNV